MSNNPMGNDVNNENGDGKGKKRIGKEKVMICPASMPIFRKAVVAVAGCSTDVPDA
jgi:hypothetical protein